MKSANKSFLLLLLNIAVWSCKEPFDPPVIAGVDNFLVVEGGINGNNGSVNIILTRTVGLDSREVKPELDAFVSIETESDRTFNLYTPGGGNYFGSILPLDRLAKYRLKIHTAEGKDYISDYVSINTTPPIDKLGWKRDNGGVQLFLNTKGTGDNARYYRWEYEETWEFHTDFYSALKVVSFQGPKGITYLVTDLSPFEPYPYHNICWQTERSTTIHLASTVKLKQNEVFEEPISFIPRDSWKLSKKYSILVRQYGLDRKAFDYWENMKKNSEELGGIFSPQPSESGGNIHCINSPGETVIGYFEACEISTKRIFIDGSEVPDWRYTEHCQSEILKSNEATALNLFGGNPIPLAWADDQKLTILTAPNYCVDCAVRGSALKPTFWP